MQSSSDAIPAALSIPNAAPGTSRDPHGHHRVNATIILPTYNERENIPHAIAAITEAMSKQ
ncbi:MAG TPA: hypothetical protein VHX44_18655 [Planctomycetota bacterium]|nr:hypothetical protein [Planctomycetota bacterium]